MKKIYRTSKGVIVDMEALRAKHAKTVATGNMGVNAQGDKLGRGGEVVATVQEQARAYNKNNPKAVRVVSVKDPVGSDSIKEDDKLDVIETVKKTPAKNKGKKEMKELDDGSFEIIDDKESGED